MTDSEAAATLTKWGNSQGFVIPKKICKAANFHIGDSAIITSDESGRIIIDHKITPHYMRKRVVTLEEFAANWQGAKAGEEWSGSDVGAEVVL